MKRKTSSSERLPSSKLTKSMNLRNHSSSVRSINFAYLRDVIGTSFFLSLGSSTFQIDISVIVYVSYSGRL